MTTWHPQLVLGTIHSYEGKSVVPQDRRLRLRYQCYDPNSAVLFK